MTMRLDMSIGPVQGFVAQSRRTRDLWGSSYLLSFLAAHAMHGAQQAGGRITRPVVDKDPLYLWVSGVREGGAPPMGTLPNHFVLEMDRDAPNAARAGIRALNEAWEQVCSAVWAQFVEHACPAGDGTEQIWNRQARAYWEVMWTVSESGDGLLARRKHWRSHRLPDEPGDKCTVMHDLQELSGHVRSESRERAEKQDRFWDSVRQRLDPLDLRDNERLCAIALVKRMFPKVAAKAPGVDVDTSHWPSTVYVGAVPWIRRVLDAAPHQARQYGETIRGSARDVIAERRPPFQGLQVNTAGDFPKLDANYFHREFVVNERLCPLDDGVESGTRDELSRLLKTIYESKDGADRQLGPPSTFYALLLADGDRLGRLVGKLGEQPVGRALAAFTARVPETVREHDGVTIYAGGDDVLAMLPVSQALSCAASLSRCYMSAFAGVDAGATASLSAAVTFAHVRLPLDTVITEAHRLLDDVAKDANGRDSLAAGVMKRGGLHSQWVTTWIRRHTDGASSCASELLGDLAALLGRSALDRGLSSALIYRIRETLTMLCGWSWWKPGAWGDLPTGFDARELLRAEVLRSLAGSSVENAETRADELTGLVWKLLRPSRATTADDDKGTRVVGVDALLLARFLADPGRGEGD